MIKKQIESLEVVYVNDYALINVKLQVFTTDEKNFTTVENGRFVLNPLSSLEGIEYTENQLKTINSVFTKDIIEGYKNFLKTQES